MKGKKFLVSLLAAFLGGVIICALYLYSGLYYERISKKSEQLMGEIEIRRASESKMKEEISLLKTTLQETKAELAEKTRLAEDLKTKLRQFRKGISQRPSLQEMRRKPSGTQLRGDTERKPTALVENGYHEVQPGDTLFGIALQYGISVDELCRLNDITPEQLIYPGQKLLVSPSLHQ